MVALLQNLGLRLSNVRTVPVCTLFMCLKRRAAIAVFADYTQWASRPTADVHLKHTIIVLQCTSAVVGRPSA